MDQQNECRQFCSGLANTGKLEGHLYELKYHQLWPRGGTGNLGRKGGKGTVVPVTLSPCPIEFRFFQSLGLQILILHFILLKLWSGEHHSVSCQKHPGFAGTSKGGGAPARAISSRVRNDFPGFCSVLFPFVCLIPSTSSFCLTCACLGRRRAFTWY